MEMTVDYHKHSIILNEDYIARKGDVCGRCNEQIISCKSFVYSCSRNSSTSNTSSASTSVENECVKLLWHKTCAELPQFIINPTNQKQLLTLRSKPPKSFLESLLRRRDPKCYICGIRWSWFSYCHLLDHYSHFYVCIKCAIYHVHSFEDRHFNHPSHPQHTLTIVQRPSSFKCDACNMDDDNRDLSYICTKCPFWMHKSCAHAPTSFQFQFHNKHPLILSFSLPKMYHKFDQYCRLCDDQVGLLNWLYYCPKCRFFAHFQCARSSQMLSCGEKEKYEDFVHLPAPDESCVNLLREQFVKDTSALNNNDDSNGNFSAANGIKHWIHDEHNLQLITINEFNEQKGDDDEMVLVCHICVKPIRTDGNLLYACVPCKYYMHKVCAEFPKEIEHHLWPHKTLLANKLSAPFNYFICDGCLVPFNGLYFTCAGVVALHKKNFDFEKRDIRLHIGCATLPKLIKHEAHHHKLEQVYRDGYGRFCKACDHIGTCKHGCKECDYYVCDGCIMKPRKVKHPWDPHPLNLIFEPGLAMDHEHEFNCEYCSGDIDANLWFYHCDLCDLSFHLGKCFERSCYREYSNVKFGASNIVIDKMHNHGLTFVLNKKVRSCKICNRNQLGRPVLECAAPCKAIFCIQCCKLSTMIRTMSHQQ